jgi:hypothetical protein
MSLSTMPQTMRRPRPLLFLFAVLAGVSSHVSAQAFPVTAWAPQIMPRVLYNVVRDSLAAKRPDAVTLGAAPATSAATSPVFEPSLARRRANIIRRIEQMQTVDAEGATVLRTATATGDTLAAFASRVKPAGINAYSVADVFAAWINITWEEMQSPPASSLALLRLRAQVERALREIPAFASASDAEKQEFAEALILNLLATAPRLRDARENAAARASVLVTLKRAAAELRVDFEHMTGTAQGFMPSDMVTPQAKP